MKIQLTERELRNMIRQTINESLGELFGFSKHKAQPQEQEFKPINYHSQSIVKPNSNVLSLVNSDRTLYINVSIQNIREVGVILTAIFDDGENMCVELGNKPIPSDDEIVKFAEQCVYKKYGKYETLYCIHHHNALPKKGHNNYFF